MRQLARALTFLGCSGSSDFLVRLRVLHRQHSVWHVSSCQRLFHTSGITGHRKSRFASKMRTPCHEIVYPWARQAVYVFFL
eukprot:8443778-Alexandrium_andersonii.AAC.1